MGGGNYPPPGPLTCPANDGAQNGPGGRSNSRPRLGSPPQGTSLISPSKGKISNMSGATMGG